MRRLLAVALTLCLTAPLGLPLKAQMIVEEFHPNGEKTAVHGPYKRYFHHVLKLSPKRYAVLFEPGFLDTATARDAVAPLCQAQGARAEVHAQIAPVDLVFIEGMADILQGIRVDCV